MQENTLTTPSVTTPKTVPALPIWRVVVVQIISVAGVIYLMFFMPAYFMQSDVFRFLEDLFTPEIAKLSSVVRFALKLLELRSDEYILAIMFCLEFGSFIGPLLAAAQLLLLWKQIRWPFGWFFITWLVLPLLLSSGFFILILFRNYFNLNFYFDIYDDKPVWMWYFTALIISIPSFSPGGALFGLAQSQCLREGRSKRRWVLGSVIAWTLMPVIILGLSSF